MSKESNRAEFLPAMHPFHADQKVSLSRTALGMFNALVNLAPSEQSWLAGNNDGDMEQATSRHETTTQRPPAPFCTEQNP